MNRILTCLMAGMLLLTLSGCGGASQEKLDAMFERYNELCSSLEHCGETLLDLGVSADSELGMSYGDWGDTITALADEINENANRMDEQDVQSMLSRMAEMQSTIDETQDELDGMLRTLDITGRWNFEDESGRFACFDNGIFTICSAEEDMLEKGTYEQNGIFVKAQTEENEYSGVTDGAVIVFGEGEDALKLNFCGFLE